MTSRFSVHCGSTEGSSCFYLYPLSLIISLLKKNALFRLTAEQQILTSSLNQINTVLMFNVSSVSMLHLVA